MGSREGLGWEEGRESGGNKGGWDEGIVGMGRRESKRVVEVRWVGGRVMGV